MSTRGYAFILDKSNGKIIDSCGISSDAYLSGFGLEFLTEAFSGNIYTLVSDTREDYEDEEEFSLSWIMRTKESKELERYEFAEYGYIYIKSTDVMKVYRYGELLYTIKREEYDKYKYFFENFDEIEDYLSYDKDLFSYDFDDERIAKTIKDISLDELKKMYRSSQFASDFRVILNDGHLILAGHDYETKHYVYGKPCKIGDKQIMFICECDNKAWSVLVQLPYIRTYVTAEQFTSEKKAVEFIREFIRSTGAEKLKHTAEIMEKLEKVDMNVFYEDRKALYRFCDNVEYEWNRQPWCVFDGRFSPQSINHNYVFNYNTFVTFGKQNA